MILNPLSGYLGPINRVFREVSIWDREWDMVCILDGCRVDTFHEVHGPHDSIRSIASTSETWLPRTFDGHESGVGLITGNPYTPQLDLDRFSCVHVEPPTETELGVETVNPDTLTRYAIDVWRRRETLGLDRLVVHFMQPHVPFRSRPEWFEGYTGTDTWGSAEWQSLATGTVDREAWFTAYRDNLEWVLTEGVEPLLQNADATVAITADHGNAAGEWGFYGHPRGCPVSAVRRVPWDTIEASDEETLDGVAPSRDVPADVEHHLAALGYT